MCLFFGPLSLCFPMVFVGGLPIISFPLHVHWRRRAPRVLKRVVEADLQQKVIKSQQYGGCVPMVGHSCHCRGMTIPEKKPFILNHQLTFSSAKFQMFEANDRNVTWCHLTR